MNAMKRKKDYWVRKLDARNKIEELDKNQTVKHKVCNFKKFDMVCLSLCFQPMRTSSCTFLCTLNLSLSLSASGSVVF